MHFGLKEKKKWLEKTQMVATEELVQQKVMRGEGCTKRKGNSDIERNLGTMKELSPRNKGRQGTRKRTVLR